jgi:hypothetical protein
LDSCSGKNIWFLPGPIQTFVGKINSLMARIHFSKLNSWPSLKCSRELILNSQLL